jgi:tetratricopeptide (TPR) repeat protein
MFLTLLAAAAATPSPQEARFESCVALSDANPPAALTEASAWRSSGGGVLARQCEGLAYAAQKRWAPAATAFEQAAREAERDRDGRAARIWVQAGNAALAGGDAAKARGFFESAIVSGVLKGEELGEAYLDRARATAMLGQTRIARSDLDQALKLVPADPLGWLLSATMARRDGDLARAAKDIEEAAKRAPDEPGVMLEAGNIAVLSGSDKAARAAWEAAVKAAPTSPAGKAAAEQLARLP